MNKILKAVLLSFITLFAMTACSPSTSSSTSFTQEDAEEQFNSLWDNVLEAATNNDRELLEANCTSDSSSEYIDQILSADFSQECELTDALYIGQKDDAYYFCKGQYLVSNPYTSDYSIDYGMGLNCMKKEDGQWKLKLNDEALNDTIALLFTSDYYGEEAQSAYLSGRKYFTSSSAKAKRTNEFCFPGAIDVSVDGAWQNEDNSVTVLISLSNGMDKSLHFTDGDVSIENVEQGEILYSGLNFDITVEPGATEYEEFTFEAYEVNLDLWDMNKMSYEVSDNYDYI